MIQPSSSTDELLSRDGRERFHQALVGLGYVPAFPGARKMFRDTETGVKVEIVTTGEFPGNGKEKPVCFPDPGQVALERDGYKVVSLETLVELKLASGLSAAHRLKDLADVQELIAILNLPFEFSERLDPLVRGEFQRLWKTIQQAYPEIFESSRST